MSLGASTFASSPLLMLAQKNMDLVLLEYLHLPLLLVIQI